MRTVFFFVKDIGLGIFRRYRTFTKHLKHSFIPDTPKSSIDFCHGFLDVDVISSGFNIENFLDGKRPTISLEPLAGVGPVGIKAKSQVSLGIRNLEILMPFVLELIDTYKGLTLLVINMSQITCHDEHINIKHNFEEQNCHAAMLRNITLKLRELADKGQISVLLFDNRELLGQKNSAHIERLFLFKES